MKDITFSPGYTGVQFTTNTNKKFCKELFTEKELKILEEVAEKFKNKNAAEISELSHQESGWIKNNSQRGLINYNYAFELNQI